ncbi:unnamed protein product, partial [Ectocarpus sp. 4 AP-2014]
MYFVPFASWLGLDSTVRPRSPRGGTRRNKGTMACTQDKMIGSWIVNYDDKGLPYWTNDVSEESTYRLLVQQTD